MPVVFEDMLRRQNHKEGWGMLLIYPEDLKGFYRGGLVLDVGCNRGYLSGVFPDPSLYVGVDIICYGEHPPLFVVGDGHHLPFKSGAFDFVTMIETLEHLASPYNALKECMRVLKKPGGRLFIQTPPVESPAAARDPTHLQSFAKWALLRLLNYVFHRAKLVSVTRGPGNGHLIVRVEV